MLQCADFNNALNYTTTPSFLTIDTCKTVASLLSLPAIAKMCFENSNLNVVVPATNLKLKGFVTENLYLEKLEKKFPCLLIKGTPLEYSEDCIKKASFSIQSLSESKLFFEAFTKKMLFAEQLKSETLGIHRAVEEHSFVKALLTGELKPEEYFSHLVDLQYIYEALEAALRISLEKEPRLESIYYKNLERSDELKKDLSAPEFMGLLSLPSKEAILYRKHLEEISRTEPLLLIAHAYTRYLGDLSGGAILKNHIVKRWPNAVNFYNFDALLKEHSLNSKMELKNLYKAKMNSIDMTPRELNSLIKEGYSAFRFAGKLFDAIRAN